MQRYPVTFVREQLVDYCHRWQIVELALFGSVLRDDFRPDSDIDILVIFAPGVHWKFQQRLDMKAELESLLGRSVDLVEKRLVENSKNFIRRKHILDHHETIYVA